MSLPKGLTKRAVLARVVVLSLAKLGINTREELQDLISALPSSVRSDPLFVAAEKHLDTMVRGVC